VLLSQNLDQTKTFLTVSTEFQYGKIR